jgi:hypothetical protein
MALTVYEVVRGISQAIANKHHGALDDKGNLQEIGLKREEQPIRDQRVMDGFGVVIHGDKLIIKYHSVEPIRELHQKKFEKEVERRVNDVKSYIMKEFQKHTGSALRLKEVGDMSVLVETSNRMKAMIKAVMGYEILNLKEVAAVAPDTHAVDKLAEMDAYYKKLEKGKLKVQNRTAKVK